MMNGERQWQSLKAMRNSIKFIKTIEYLKNLGVILLEQLISEQNQHKSNQQESDKYSSL